MTKPTIETGVIEVQSFPPFRRPVVRTPSGVYLLDHPYWMTKAGCTVKVEVAGSDQFAKVIEN